MRRLGTLDNGGVLVEMTNQDVIRLMDGCKALGELFDTVTRGTGLPVKEQAE